MNPQAKPPAWTVDRKLSVGGLVLICLMVVGLVRWGAALENRISLNEERAAVAAEARKADQVQLAQLWSGLNARLDRLDGKIDQLLLEKGRK